MRGHLRVVEEMLTFHEGLCCKELRLKSHEMSVTMAHHINIRPFLSTLFQLTSLSHYPMLYSLSY